MTTNATSTSEANDERWPRPHRWTYAHFMQMADIGLFENGRVELIEGEIIEMAPRDNRHAAAVSRIARELVRIFDESFFVKIQATVRLDDRTAPEPEFAVLPGSPTANRASHPLPLLVVEVSNTTLTTDLDRKAELYAGFGIADYWVVNLVDRQVVVHREPVADSSGRRRGRYQDVRMGANGVVRPLTNPQDAIEVARLIV